MSQTKSKKNSWFTVRSPGFTIIEVIVGIAVFAILLSGILGAYSVLARSVQGAREKTILSTLSTQYLEIVRNLPYSSVGTASGNPNGSLPDLVNAITSTIENQQYKIYYEVTYVDDPADGVFPADVTASDYKQVKMFIEKVSTGVITAFVTNVSPKGLEGLDSGGALFIKVFNASGQPVANANVRIQTLTLIPAIDLNRQTDADGNWTELALPAGVNEYRITVTKAGYSTDRTYPITVQNPNPTKPDSTIVAGQITQVSFAIDLLSNLTIRTVNTLCQPISGVGINVRGSKLIGTNPDVLKYDQNHTSAAGQVAMTNIEWDTYVPVLLAGEPYTIYGTSPIQQVTVLPNTTQVFTFVLGPASTNSLRVIVKDAATGTALEGASVHLRKGGSTPQDYYGTSGGSVWKQLDWTGGAGQVNYVDTSRYFADDGNVDINSVPTGLRLLKITGQYVFSGQMESSTFDTGANSNFTSINWDPTSQNPATTLKFQIATNTDNATWNYKGPDGTDATYYTVPGTSINAIHDNDRYVRYKAFLSTTDDKKTPVLTGLHINYVSGCFTPGQVIFPDLTAGNNYDLDITLSGYQTHVQNGIDISGNLVIEVLMTP